MTLKQLKKEARKDLDKQFSIGIGRKWIMTEEEAREVKDFIDSLLDKALEEGKKIKVMINNEEIKDFTLTYTEGFITCVETMFFDSAGNITEKRQYIDETWYEENRNPEYIGQSVYNKQIPENEKLCIIL